MSFENLKNNYSKLLEFLEKEKYSATVIRCVSREIKTYLKMPRQISGKLTRTSTMRMNIMDCQKMFSVADAISCG